MAEVGHSEAIRTNEFVVEIEGIESPNVTAVRDLSEGKIDYIEQPDGGARVVHKIPTGVVKYPDIKLERYLDGTKTDSDFKEWFGVMFQMDGEATRSRIRRNGSIVIKEFGQEVTRFVFEGGWITDSRFSDCDASSPQLMKHTIVLAVERQYRV